MPFFLLTDTHADDQIWDVLAGGRPATRLAIKAAYVDLMSKASHLKTNGYLTHALALQYCGHKRVLDALTRSVLDRPPRLHRRGDECECLAGAEWIDGYEYRLHAFLKRNPSKREYDRNRAQKADLRDARLKKLVYDRDGGCCRYCRSGPLSPKAGRSKDRRRILQFDHVNPDQAAGPDGEGLVTSCARCNEHKGARTPDEADMVLLPVPTDAERAQWAAREVPARNDLPAGDHRQINDESATDHRHDGDRDGDRVSDPPNGSSTRDTDTSGEQARPDQDEHGDDHAPAAPGKGPGWGGQPGPSDPPPSSPRDHPGQQPTRPAGAPDIYTRRSRSTPPTHRPNLGPTGGDGQP
jgi:5-methylcytosine-specific restriction endonuclease McrA